MLFDNIKREYRGPALFSEPQFRFLNRSARSEAMTIRDTLETWFSRYPEGQTKRDIEGRFRSGDDAQYRSAFFELVLHELLLQLNCKAESHPPIEGTTNRPDFLAIPPTGSPFYLEAAIVSDESDEEAAARARLNAIHDVLDQIDAPDLLVGWRISGLPVSPPPARQIRAFLERHLTSTDADEIADIWKSKGFDAVPRWPFSDTDWKIEFYPIPKKAEGRGRHGGRRIGFFTLEPRWIDSASAIKSTLLEKARRYGELNLPYVIAINALTEFPIHKDEVMEALFGTEHFLIPRDPANQTGVGTEITPDGLWTSPTGPRYTRVSCVLITTVDAWDIPEAPICLYHNPWAKIKYDSPLTNLPQARAQNDEMKWLNGKSLGELLHLPPKWPEA
jgi:hypothetical protein